jgi:hypothetical protein
MSDKRTGKRKRKSASENGNPGLKPAGSGQCAEANQYTTQEIEAKSNLGNDI